MSDAPSKDFYSEKLVEVNKTNSVVATQNIYNEQGALIVPEGASISAETAKRIALHKLNQPLELSVSVETTVTRQDMVKELGTLPSSPELVEIFTSELSTRLFKEAVVQLDQYPLVVQKLTVMRQCLPGCYKNAILGAAVSAQICDGLKLPLEERNAVFIAALVRDIGLLHIDPAVAVKEYGYTASEWNLYKGHVAVAYHLLGLENNIPKLTKQAVLEHHERADGFGYPRGKVWPALSLAGQIVAFADMAVVLAERYVVRLGYSTRALAPIVQLNANQHTPEVASAALSQLARLAGPRKLLYSKADVPRVRRQLCCAHPLVSLLAKQIEEFWVFLKQLVPHLELTAIENALNDLRNCVASSGVYESVIVQWVRELDPDEVQDDDLLEIENYGLMLGECAWKFSQLFQSFVTFPDSHQIDAVSAEQIRGKYQDIEKTASLLQKVRKS
ncbi:MAG: HD-GYP domain-containing protein [Pseudomonadales bacterium]|jgi:hypothetical protein